MQKKETKDLLANLTGTKTEQIPIWFLRQAGRYLPEYQEIRKKNSFLNICQSPKLACEITLQPLRRYDLDAAIIFSDILFPLTAVGQKLTFTKGEGPQLTPPIRTKTDLKKLNFDLFEEKVSAIGEALSLVKSQLDDKKTLIGFAGAPFTVASYMIEGAPTKNFAHLKRLLFSDQETYSEIMTFLVEMTRRYLKIQIDAGADTLMLFDTWAGQMSPLDFQEYSKKYLTPIFNYIHQEGTPLIYYPGANVESFLKLDTSKLSCLAVDWRISFRQALECIEKKYVNKYELCLQGNLDPQCLLGSESFVRSRTQQIINEIQKLGINHYIFNVGHGLLPTTPLESLNWVIDEVKKFKL